MKEKANYFDTQNGVNEYIKMVDGYNGQELIEIIHKFVPSGSNILEIGMGPGNDIPLLEQHFNVTASDHSTIFTNRYLSINPKADILVLDAVTIDTDRRFDAIYSNKVLQHLTKNEVAKSLIAQHRILNPGGIAFHSLWHGNDLEEHHGLLFQQYTTQIFAELINERFDVLESKCYTEDVKDDSLYIVLKRLNK